MGIFTVIIIVLFAKNIRVKKHSKEVFNSTLFHIDLNFLPTFFCSFSFVSSSCCWSFLSFSSTYFLAEKHQWTYFLFGLSLLMLLDAGYWCCCFLYSVFLSSWFRLFCSALSATIVEPIRNIYRRCGLHLQVLFFCCSYIWFCSWCS